MRNQTNLNATCTLLVVLTFLVAATPVVARAEPVRQQVVKSGKASIHVTASGRGVPIVFIPSLGRGVHDFDDLSKRLTRSGYQTILPEPRGIGSSTGPLDGITLHDLATDIAAVIQTFAGGPAIVVGHGFGNRVARVVATDHPRLVKQVVLLSAGGTVPMSEKTQEAFARVFDPKLAKNERLAAIGAAFFARGHEPEVWQDGWYFDVSKAQQAESEATPVKEWWAGGSAPIVVLQGTEDVIGSPENSARLAKEFPDRVRVIQIPRAGHAMLPEQPDQIASAILNSLK